MMYYECTWVIFLYYIRFFEILDTMTGICGEILIRLTSPLDQNSSILTKSLNWI